MLPQQYCLRWKYHHNNLQTMFSQLLDRGCFCDVTLACEGQIIRAHRVVLCACSTFFDTLLSSYATEPIIIMKDAKFADIKCLIEFMYKGEINVEHANLGSLLKTAEDLKIKGLAEVSWRDEEFDSAIPEPEQKFHEGILPLPTIIPQSLLPSAGFGGGAAALTATSQHSLHHITKENHHNNNDGLNNIPQHRIHRMPLLTPIPSPLLQSNDNFGPKRKRGRPPLDDSYDVFSSPKISFIKGSGIGGNNSNTQSPFRDNSPTVIENQPIEEEIESPKYQHILSPDSQSPKPSIPPPSTKSSTILLKNSNTDNNGQTNDTNHDWIKKHDIDSENESRQPDDEITLSHTLPKNEQSDEYEYYDQKSDPTLDDLDSENNLMTVTLTTAELEEWKDVIKMDAYLSRGRRPQFWEEPFTKRVMEAIKSKKLEMKKAAQVLGVSYGTLYGRYRETYGCLKHPYRNQQYYTKRLRGALATIRRCEEVLTVHTDSSSNNFQDLTTKT